MVFFRHRVSGPGSAGDIWTTTMHSNGANTLSATHTAWTALINTFLSGTLNALWPNDVSATETVTDQLDPLTGKNTAQARTAIAQVGTGAGGTTSPRTAIVIGLRTALPTRAGRGRMYWPAPDATHFQANGNLVAADVTAIANGFRNALATFAATSVPVIYHRLTRTGTNITLVTVGVIAGTQRRRTNKVANSYTSVVL